MTVDLAKDNINGIYYDYESGHNNYDADEEDMLFQRVPLQTNQNSLIQRLNKSKDHGTEQYNRNYMQQCLQLRRPMNFNKNISTDIFYFQRTDEVNQHKIGNEYRHVVSQTYVGIDDKFNYDPENVIKFREDVKFETNCEWLDSRLETFHIVDDVNISLDQLIYYLRMSFINVSNDLMIYYHTRSEFALQLLRLECFNLLILLKDPKLQIVLTSLYDGFSQLLLSIVENKNALDTEDESVDINIPLLVENIMNNFVLLDPKKQSLKTMFRSIPKVVFYSFFVPSCMVIKNNQIDTILGIKIISLQRKCCCKFIIDGPCLRKSSSKKMDEYYRFDIFFDYEFNYWIVLKNELLKWINSFIRSSLQCHMSNVVLSFVAESFFCCDEIQNLMKRQHLFRELDPNFTKIIKWAKTHHLDKMTL